MWNPCEGHERDSNAGSGTDTCIGPPVTRRQHETHVAALELKLSKRMRHIERLDEVIRRRNKQVEELSEMLLATGKALNSEKTRLKLEWLPREKADPGEALSRVWRDTSGAYYAVSDSVPYARHWTHFIELEQEIPF